MFPTLGSARCALSFEMFRQERQRGLIPKRPQTTNEGIACGVDTAAFQDMALASNHVAVIRHQLRGPRSGCKLRAAPKSPPGAALLRRCCSRPMERSGVTWWICPVARSARRVRRERCGPPARSYFPYDACRRFHSRPTAAMPFRRRSRGSSGDRPALDVAVARSDPANAASA